MKKNKENILVTRALKKESSLWQLNSENREVIAQSFLDIIPIKISGIPQAEIYFFYSKNAARYFILSARELSIDLTSAKYATMGSGTANTMIEQGLEPDFIGQGSPAEVSAMLKAKYSKNTICFVRAEDSTQSIQKLWPTDYSELITYRAKPKTVKLEQEIHTIFATSPINLGTALTSCDISNLQHVICIGKTTYAFAIDATTAKVSLAAENNERSMLNCYLENT